MVFFFVFLFRKDCVFFLAPEKQRNREHRADKAGDDRGFAERHAAFFADHPCHHGGAEKIARAVEHARDGEEHVALVHVDGHGGGHGEEGNVADGIGGVPENVKHGEPGKLAEFAKPCRHIEKADAGKGHE